ncbi:YlbF family regulator [Chengkuizengella axinellae]|uniref:YlbF family regulator n=1 Tax=Chengkuizengella axinellae TaxID=3064388 RepID=A0ABT9IVF6_9BACL|nr:YlbF family regulator [Chengkuizengella sp. 2205SS18-9]MDP5273336.1 YlbF family regulator [Chengkuizengella sp. 2205SS18-9]
MSVYELTDLDMSTLLMEAYDLGDMINASEELNDYLFWKKEIEKDAEVQIKVNQFLKKKEIYEDCERFGQFHPDYHSALEEVQKVEKELNELNKVRKFKESEEKIDLLLYSISKTLAHEISEEIKVPSNNPLPTVAGCGSGGCSGKCS